MTIIVDIRRIFRAEQQRNRGGRLSLIFITHFLDFTVRSALLCICVVVIHGEVGYKYFLQENHKEEPEKDKALRFIFWYCFMYRFSNNNEI